MVFRTAFRMVFRMVFRIGPISSASLDGKWVTGHPGGLHHRNQMFQGSPDMYPGKRLRS